MTFMNGSGASIMPVSLFGLSGIQKRNETTIPSCFLRVWQNSEIFHGNPTPKIEIPAKKTIQKFHGDHCIESKTRCCPNKIKSIQKSESGSFSNWHKECLYGESVQSAQEPLK